ncbi:Acyl-CoA N-acyltransferase protein [Dioscorea alata]|nr:Acyl-CoA N-acyltransferase protein [Dioscorea alata]
MVFLSVSNADSIIFKTPPSSKSPCFSQQIAPRHKERLKFENYGRKRGLVCCSSPAKEVDLQRESEKCGNVLEDKYLVMKYGWGVRRMAQVGEEMRSVAHVQAEAFHVPMLLFNNLFFEFFKAEVLSALIYKIRNSPPDRYACLVAESVNANTAERVAETEIVGVVDVTVQRDNDIVKHLQGAEEYVYVSGICVPTKFR